MSMSFTAISVTRYDAYGLSTDIEDLMQLKNRKEPTSGRRKAIAGPFDNERFDY